MYFDAAMKVLMVVMSPPIIIVDKPNNTKKYTFAGQIVTAMGKFSNNSSVGMPNKNVRI